MNGTSKECVCVSLFIIIAIATIYRIANKCYAETHSNFLKIWLFGWFRFFS